MAASGTLVLRLSVPAQGELRPIAGEIAAKVALYLGDETSDVTAVGAALESVAARVAPNGSGGDIAFEFREIDGELVIEARCGTQSSEVRCPLPA